MGCSTSKTQAALPGATAAAAPQTVLTGGPVPEVKPVEPSVQVGLAAEPAAAAEVKEASPQADQQTEVKAEVTAEAPKKAAA